MIAEKHLSHALAVAVGAAQIEVDLCQVELSMAEEALAADRAAREQLDETDVDAVIRADEAVRLAFRNRGRAADDLEKAHALLARRKQEAMQ